MIASEAENPFFALSDETVTSNRDLFEAADDLSDVSNDHETWETEAEDNLATTVPGAQTDDPVDLYFRT